MRAAPWAGLAALSLALGCTGPGAGAKQERRAHRRRGGVGDGDGRGHRPRRSGRCCCGAPTGHSSRCGSGPRCATSTRFARATRSSRRTWTRWRSSWRRTPTRRRGRRVDRRARAAGAKPGVVTTNVVELTARVESVDRRARTLTLVGAQGVVGTFHVDPSVPLDRIDPGDDVVARVTEAIAIEVVAP